MWESMGPIADRSVERLGASDQAIVEFRRLMVEAARRVRDGGPAIGTPAVCATPQAQIASFEGMLPKGEEWRELDTVQAQAEHRKRMSDRQTVTA
jgi:phthalate 4,5-dioxygenase oxygenase subunit